MGWRISSFLLLLVICNVLLSKAEDRYRNGGSTVYVRWGRTVCAKTASKIYDGFVAGSGYHEKGGSSAYTCLPRVPQWGRYVNGNQWGGHLYGTEYQRQGYSGLLLRTNNWGASLHNQNVPCVLCLARGKHTSWTFPAMWSCPSGWQKEYRGYLMAAHVTEHPVVPECLDEAPEAVYGGQANTNGAVMYNIESKCGTLPCPPYVDGRELTCVVCTY